jgi:hypothetical protein
VPNQNWNHYKSQKTKVKQNFIHLTYKEAAIVPVNDNAHFSGSA